MRTTFAVIVSALLLVSCNRARPTTPSEERAACERAQARDARNVRALPLRPCRRHRDPVPWTPERRGAE